MRAEVHSKFGRLYLSLHAEDASERTALEQFLEQCNRKDQTVSITSSTYSVYVKGITDVCIGSAVRWTRRARWKLWMDPCWRYWELNQ